jgi:hypothetical protein
MGWARVPDLGWGRRPKLHGMQEVRGQVRISKGSSTSQESVAAVPECCRIRKGMFSTA